MIVRYLVVSDEAFVMLLTEPFFKTFTKRELCGTTTHTEGLLAVSCNSRTEVDDMVKKGVAAGGKHALDPQDYGFMYSWSFYDPTLRLLGSFGIHPQGFPVMADARGVFIGELWIELESECREELHRLLQVSDGQVDENLSGTRFCNDSLRGVGFASLPDRAKCIALHLSLWRWR